MKKIRPEKTQSRHEFLKWYHVASLGQTLQENEAAFLRGAVNIAYNQRILQVGRLGSESRYLDPEMSEYFVLTDKHGPRSTPIFVQAHAGCLPFAQESIDTLILPHVLEFVSDRHQVLREAERVLKPEGQLFILGLNPWSPLRFIAFPKRLSSFWRSYLIDPRQLLDWLSLLKFDAEIEAVFGSKTTIRPQRSDDRLIGIKQFLAMGYAIRAIKRNFTIIPLDPEWTPLKRLVSGKLIDAPQLNRERSP